jgi:hypothetical protein
MEHGWISLSFVFKKGLLQNAAAQRREKNEKRKEEVFSYEND